MPVFRYDIPSCSFSGSNTVSHIQNGGGRSGGPKHVSKKSLNILQNLFSGEKSDDVPLATLRSNRRDSVAAHDAIDEETERHLYVIIFSLLRLI